MKILPQLITILGLCLSLALHWNSLVTKVDPTELAGQFNQSKYVLGGAGGDREISDEIVYMHAGNEYIKGVSPLQINFEHPPFFKYLFGLSQKYFGTPTIVIAISFIIWSISFYLLVRIGIRHPVLQSLALLVFFLNPLTHRFVTKPMLDVPLAMEMLLCLVLLQRLLNTARARYAILIGIVAGLLFSTKYPIPISITFVGLITLFVLKKRILFAVLISFFALTTYLTTYLGAFSKDLTFIQYLQFERWRLSWFMGKTDSPKGYIFSTILFGKHPQWWADKQAFVSYDSYSIIWPIVFIGFLCNCVRLLHERKLNIQALMHIQVAFSLAFLSLGASNDFYLIPLMPIFTLSTAQFTEYQFMKKGLLYTHKPVDRLP